MAERPWVGVESVAPLELYRGADGISIALLTSYTLKNYGNAAAQHVKVLPELSLDQDFNKVHGCSSQYSETLGEVILPTQQRIFSVAAGVHLADVQSAVKRQNPALGDIVPIYLVGCVYYVDGGSFSEVHHTSFSYIVFKQNDYVRLSNIDTPSSDLKLVPNFVVNSGPTN